MGDRVDEFESLFRSADKPHYRFQPVDVRSALLVTDLAAAETAELERRLRDFTADLPALRETRWSSLCGDDFGSIRDVLAELVVGRPDLVVTYRNLKEADKSVTSTLGSYVDVLTQSAHTPVLLLPDLSHEDFGRHLASAARSMVVTDYVTGDDRLISYGVSFTRPGGDLYLSHIEPGRTFERYLDVIGKIPEIDTALARETIGKQLLKEPRDYVESCRLELRRQRVPVAVHPVVRLGYRLRDYESLIDEHALDLLILECEDEAQQAMHALAYSLAVEFRHFPLLLI